MAILRTTSPSDSPSDPVNLDATFTPRPDLIAEEKARRLEAHPIDIAKLIRAFEEAHRCGGIVGVSTMRSRRISGMLKSGI